MHSLAYKESPSAIGQRGLSISTSIVRSSVQDLLQRLASLERGGLGSADADDFPSHGVVALAGGTVLRLEGAEADQRNLLALLQGLHDGIENAVEDLVHVLAGNGGFFCYDSDKIAEESSMDKMARFISTSVKAQKSFLMKITPLFLKQFFLKLGRLFTASRQTIIFSNLGRIKVPSEFGVEYFYFNMNASKSNTQNLGAVTTDSRAVFTLTRAVKEKDFSNQLFNLIEKEEELEEELEHEEALQNADKTKTKQ